MLIQSLRYYLGLKVTLPLNLYLLLFSLFHFYCFSSLFFHLAGDILGLISVGNVSKIAILRIILFRFKVRVGSRVRFSLESAGHFFVFSTRQTEFCSFAYVFRYTPSPCPRSVSNLSMTINTDAVPNCTGDMHGSLQAVAV